MTESCFFLECSAFQPLYIVNIGRNRKRTKPASRQNLNETKIKLHEGNRQSAFDPPFKGTYGDCSVSRVNQLILQSSVCKNATICTGFQRQGTYSKWLGSRDSSTLYLSNTLMSK